MSFKNTPSLGGNKKPPILLLREKMKVEKRWSLGALKRLMDVKGREQKQKQKQIGYFLLGVTLIVNRDSKAAKVIYCVTV